MRATRRRRGGADSAPGGDLMHPRRAIATCLASRVAASDSPPMTTAVRPSTDEDRHDARVEASALQQHVQHELVSVRRRVVQVARTTQEAAIAGRILPKIEGLSCFSPFTTCPPGGFLAPFVLRLCWAVKSTQTLAFLSPLHLIQQVLPWRWPTLTLSVALRRPRRPRWRLWRLRAPQAVQGRRPLCACGLRKPYAPHTSRESM